MQCPKDEQTIIGLQTTHKPKDWQKDSL